MSDQPVDELDQLIEILHISDPIDDKITISKTDAARIATYLEAVKTPPTITADTAVSEVKKLEPQIGDIVVVSTMATHPDNIRELTNAVATPLAKYLKEKNCMIMILPMGMDISLLNEKVMKENGWVKDTGKKLVVL